MLRKIKSELIALRYAYWIFRDRNKRVFLKDLNILNSESTINYINSHNCSVSRFGDGEFLIMGGGSNGFQKTDKGLAKRLITVLQNPKPNLLICIPYTFKITKHCTTNSKLFIKEFIHYHFNCSCMPFINKDLLYGDSLFTRFYMHRRNKDENMINNYVLKLKQLWNNKDILIVEGKYSQLGVGNDLFDNTRSINRIICPPQNAYDKYPTILNEVIKYSKNKLVILSIGMSATVMAYDLLEYNIRSIDIGHIDTEYEWFKQRAKKKIRLQHKIVDETSEGNAFIFNPDDEYLKQIVATVI